MKHSHCIAHPSQECHDYSITTHLDNSSSLRVSELRIDVGSGHGGETIS